MPSSLIKSIAKKAGVKRSEVEKVWNNLKAEYGENYKAIVGTLEKTFATDSDREKTPFGHLKVENCVLTAESVDDYFGSELPQGFGLEPDKVYKVYRPLEALEKGLDTYNIIPLVNEHFFVDNNTTNKDKWLGGTGSNARIENGKIINDVAVWDKNGVALVEKVKQGLSCGYSFNLVKESGVWNGKHYDLKMSDIVANHVALVATPRVKVAKMADSLINFIKEKDMDAQALIDILARKHPNLVKDAAEELEKKDCKDKKSKDNTNSEKTGEGESTDGELEKEEGIVHAKEKDKKGKDKKGKDKKSRDEEPEEEKEAMTGDSVAAIVQAKITEYNEARELCERVLGKTKFAADSNPESMFDATLKAKNVDVKGLSLDAKKALLQYIGDSKPAVKKSVPVIKDNAADNFNVIDL